jgi:hypothetical protein
MTLHEAFNAIKGTKEDKNLAAKRYNELLKKADPQQVKEFKEIRKTEVANWLSNLPPLRDEQLKISDEELKNYW